MKPKRLIKAFLASALLLAALGIAPLVLAVKPPVVNVDVTAGTSTPNYGITPSHVGNVWTYAFTAPASGLTENLPIRLCAASSAASTDPNGYPLVLGFGPQGAGGNLPGVDYSATATLTADGCADAVVKIDTGALSQPLYVKNLLVNVVNHGEPSNAQVNVNDFVIHIKVLVGEGGDGVRCFVTDSTGNWLSDCGGADVTDTSGVDAGRFSIVLNNKKIEVSTNPGQFYYNIVWANNTGSDQSVRVDFTRNNINTNGTNAIHVDIFQNFPGIDPATFEAVNAAVPSGHDDAVENVTVPNGWTMWADYHLVWPGIGSAAPAGAGLGCANANQTFSVTGTISKAVGGDFVGSCTAGAKGYIKK